SQVHQLNLLGRRIMAYNLSINTEEKYIRVDLSEELTESDIHDSMKEVLRVRQEQKLNHILCDERQLQVRPNDSIGLATATRISSGPYVGMKLAIIRKDFEERLFELVANNRSGIVKVFDDEEKAKQWLRNN
ncbi:hypothetical protein ACFLQ1_02845, partial [Candidatus Auribacterota bacterium]